MADTAEFKTDRLKKLLIRVLGYADGIPDEIADELTRIDGAYLTDKDIQHDVIESLVLTSVELILNGQSNSPKFEVFQLHILYASNGRVMKEVNRLLGTSLDRTFKFLLATYHTTKNETNNNWIEDFEIECIKQLSESIVRVTIMFLQGSITHGINNKYLGCLSSRALIANPAPVQFFRDLIFTADAQDDLVNLLTPIVDCVSRCLQQCSLADDSRDYKIPYDTLTALVSFKSDEKPPKRPVCSALVQIPNFIYEPITKAKGREAAVLSLLGPLFALSVTADDGKTDVINKHFPFEEMSSETLKMIYSSLQDPMHSVRTSCHGIVRSCLGNADSRQPMLNYLSHVITHNWKRAQIQADMSSLGNDGFMINFISVLYELSGPITLDKIDRYYAFKSGGLVDLGEEARLRMTQEEATEHTKSYGEVKDAKFTTECFFLTIHAQHITFMPALNRLKNRMRQAKDLDREISRERRLLPDLTDPAKKRESEMRIKQYEKFKSRLIKERYCAEAVLMDSYLISSALAFCVKQLEMVISIIEPNFGTAMSTDEYSLPEQAPADFAALPEFYLEDVLDLLLYFVRASPNSLTDPGSLQSSINLIQQVLVFIIHPQYFTNKFLVAKSIELLFHCTPAVGSNQVLPLFNAAAHSPLATAKLYPALVKFYAACESTGSHSAFYDKFTMRYHMQFIFKQLREDTPHFTAIMTQVARNCDDDFVRFVNMILNDTTFMLDESLEALKRIHEIEVLIDDALQWGQLSQEEQRSKREMLSQDEGSCSSWLPLVLRTLEMLNHMTRDAVEPFLKSVLGGRLAEMLNSNLAQLVGPKCTELVVRKKKEYHWEPRTLVQQIIDVYLNLNCDEFAKYIAMDERSYSKETFADIIARLTRKSIVPYSQIEIISGLFERAFNHWKDNLDAEEDYGTDIPDEFLDPIMNSLMHDPVRLPSGHVCDRSVIERHLLSQPDNPFTRDPLTIEQLAPEPDLKARLQSWITERRSAGGANR